MARPKKDEPLELACDLFGQVLRLKEDDTRMMEKILDTKRVARRFQLSEARAVRIVDEIERGVGLFRKRDQSGGTIRDGIPDSYYHEQIHRNVDLKEVVAFKAASLVPASPGIACSPGTTVTNTFQKILATHKNISVITNNCALMNLVDVGSHSFLSFTGGNYNAATNSWLGERVAEVFGSIHFNDAIVGVSGVSGDGDLHVKFSDEKNVLEAIVENAERRIFIVATIDKLGQSDMYTFASISKLAEKRNRRVFLVTNPISDFPGDPDDQNTVDLKSFAEEVLKTLGEHVAYADSIYE